MAVITAALVNELRQRTSLGMMQCKKALTEADGDLAEAEVILRKSIFGKQGAKAMERTASEGSVFARVSDDKRRGAIIELNSETDFVARNDQFKTIGRALLEKILSYEPGTVPTGLEAFLADSHNGTTVGDYITDASTTIGEKVALSRFERFGAPEGNAVAAYVHNPSGSGDEGGKYGVLVEVGGGGDTNALATLAREVALHVSSANPRYLTEDAIGSEVIDKEREIYAAQAANDEKMQSKPQAAVDAMINGRLRVFLEETVLLKQKYIRDDSLTIDALVKKTPNAGIVRFVRFKVGEIQAASATPVETEGDTAS